MKLETLSFKKENHIGQLTVERPQALNALNAQVIKDLRTFLTEIQNDKDLRVLIVTGAGEKAFVAGADIKEMEAMDPAQGQKFAENGQQVFMMLEKLAVPTIAAVNGFALGGGLELALACDFIVASKNAKLGLPEVSLGLIPGYGGTQRLSRNVGRAIARMMTLTGDMYTAEQCAQWGLVSQVTEPADLQAAVMKIAQTIAKRSPVALALAKKAIREGFDQSITDGMKIEAECFHKTFNSEDKKEGVKAFIEKRAPQFTGQ
jgi:enoyl-CoA hydratase